MESRFEPFDLEELSGEIDVAFLPRDVRREIPRLLDPGNGLRTLHWGRNYVFASRLQTGEGTAEVVVKQFPAGRARAWRRRTSKARRSWEAAKALCAAGLPTPRPVLMAESKRSGGASFLVTEDLGEVLEARYLLRAANAGTAAERFPELPVEVFLGRLAELLRRLHDAGFWHRDLSIGNVLIRRSETGGDCELFLVDLNRMRRCDRLSVSQRTRDLCRLALFRSEDRRTLLRLYWGDTTSGRMAKRVLYEVYLRAFHWRVEAKKRLRGLLTGLYRRLLPRGAHPHIPPPPPAAGARDKIVWDSLSDQPHQHAGRLERLWIRLADLPAHAESAAAVLAVTPRVWRRYRRLCGERLRRERLFTGLGVALRPDPDCPERPVRLVEELGVRRALLRLHPWAARHDAELELARELVGRGVELAFALPQNRELVRDLPRWREAVAELAAAFAPLGRQFQIGQAINRSKWGLWTYREYVALAEAAMEVLARYPGTETLGPAVIDFEPQATAAVLNSRRLHQPFDIVSSLLYVDRRGAPERRQLGFDALDKATLIKAIAETARNGSDRSWITEVNWPLWEGPHAPAGRRVAVDEDAQASYLTRYFLLLLASGMVERIYWWQLQARGYGLVDPSAGNGGRRRPAFRALAALRRELEGLRFTGVEPAPPPACLLRFEGPDGVTLAGWSRGEPVEVELQGAAACRVLDRDGQPIPGAGGPTVRLEGAVRYLRLGPDTADSTVTGY